MSNVIEFKAAQNRGQDKSYHRAQMQDALSRCARELQVFLDAHPKEGGHSLAPVLAAISWAKKDLDGGSK